VFPKVIAHGRQLFASFTDADFDEMDQALSKLKQLIARASHDSDGCPPSPTTDKEAY